MVTESFILVGICGGSGSGKSTLTNLLKKAFSPHATVISQDSYYKDLSTLSMEDREKINFDHPDSVDLDKFKNDLLSVKNGISINMPEYCFESHTRADKTLNVEPKPLTLVDGILIFHSEEIRDLFDYKIFLDADSDTRLLRRIRRDIKKRGRDIESILTQYEESVKPMHTRYVTEQATYSDIVIGTDDTASCNTLADKLKEDIDRLIIRQNESDST